MARPIVLSNGALHVGLNIFGEVHDFYFPHVGLENHAAGKSLRHRIGIWVGGRFSWIDDGSWEFTFNYHHNSLIGNLKAVNNELGITLQSDDFVSSDCDAFLRNIEIVNHFDHEREIRIFMHQVFDIGDGSSNGDTAQYLPDRIQFYIIEVAAHLLWVDAVMLLKLLLTNIV